MRSFTATYSHIWGMTKEKRLINSFALANLCDAMVTGVALMLPGFVEKGLMGAQLLADEKAIELLIVKTAITFDNGMSITNGTADVVSAKSPMAKRVKWNGKRNPSDDLSNAPPATFGAITKYAFQPYTITLLRMNVTP